MTTTVAFFTVVTSSIEQKSFQWRQQQLSKRQQISK